MANAADTKAVMTENLRDMGLDDETTAKCLRLIEEKRYAELDKLLRAYRQTLLDSVHIVDDIDNYSLRDVSEGAWGRPESPHKRFWKI